MAQWWTGVTGEHEDPWASPQWGSLVEVDLGMFAEAGWGLSLSLGREQPLGARWGIPPGVWDSSWKPEASSDRTRPRDPEQERSAAQGVAQAATWPDSGRHPLPLAQPGLASAHAAGGGEPGLAPRSRQSRSAEPPPPAPSFRLLSGLGLFPQDSLRPTCCRRRGCSERRARAARRRRQRAGPSPAPGAGSGPSPTSLPPARQAAHPAYARQDGEPGSARLRSLHR